MPLLRPRERACRDNGHRPQRYATCFRSGRRFFMSLRKALAATLLLVATTPGIARADTLIMPFFGLNFGGDSGKTFSTARESKQQTFGVSAAFFGGGVVGIEADLGHSPDFFGKGDNGGS